MELPCRAVSLVPAVSLLAGSLLWMSLSAVILLGALE